MGAAAACLPGLLAAADAAPLFWPPVRLGLESAWYGHVPFAHWFTTALRPRCVVELGTHNGVSFLAFCEAMRRQTAPGAVPGSCIAVDLWQGDAHAGFYGEAVHESLTRFVGRHYPAIATLCRRSFDAALDQVADGSVDLLHIDGRHGYADVRADHQGWRRKLSPRGVVLFHDTEERAEGFGVWRYWQELAADRPHFAFRHAHGLGVLLDGPHPPDAARALAQLTGFPAAEAVRGAFESLGARWEAQQRADAASGDAARLCAHAAALQAHIDALGAYTAQLERAVAPRGMSAPSG